MNQICKYISVDKCWGAYTVHWSTQHNKQINYDRFILFKFSFNSADCIHKKMASRAEDMPSPLDIARRSNYNFNES